MFQGKCSQENAISGICLEPKASLGDSASDSLQELDSGSPRPIFHTTSDHGVGVRSRLRGQTDRPAAFEV